MADAPLAPRPPGDFLLGHLRYYRAERARYLLRVVQEHGDIVRLAFGPVAVHFLWHPDGVRRVTVDNHRNYSKRAPGHATLRRLIGDGLITSDGDLWRTQRRIIQPAFKRSAIVRLAPLMAVATEDAIATWTDGAVIDVAAEMTRISLRVACESMLGRGIDDMATFASAAAVAIKDISDQITSPTRLPLWVPTPMNSAFNAALRTIDATVWKTIAQRRSEKEEGVDMLSLLVRAQDPETGVGMSDRQLRDELVTMLLAGHETTAGALMWTLWLLAQHPDVRAEVEAELDRLGEPPDHDDLERLPLLDRVLKESLRLLPIVWNVARGVEADDVVLGHRVPAKSVLCLTPYLSHRHPDFWDDPERFDPDRFLPEREAARPKGAYIPFMAGPRACIGAAFSTMETMLVLARVLRRFRLDLAEGCGEPEFRFTIRPTGPLVMKLCARNASK